MSSSINKPQEEDKALDALLRPQSWQDYVGQEKLTSNLRVFITAAKKRNSALDHVLLYGPPGLGKTTLAHIIAKDLNANIRITSGPAIEKVGDLASILTNLSSRDVLFIDEAHRLNKTIEEVLYPAMEQRTLDIILGKGPSARTIQLELPAFTLIAATTRTGLLSSPLRSRFGISLRLDFYDKQEIEQIVRRSAQIMQTDIAEEAVKQLARASRSTPRVANRLLKRVRDYADVENQNKITQKIADTALQRLEIDEIGLEPTDRRILRGLIKNFNGGPAGLQALAAVTSEEEDTIAEIYEPYLMQIGMIERTPRGRIATKMAYEHMNIEAPTSNQDKLL